MTDPTPTAKELNRDFCRAILPADLFQRLSNMCPDADWVKIYNLVNANGSVVVEAYLALNL